MEINNRKLLEIKGTIMAYLMIMRCSDEEAKQVLQMCIDEVELDGDKINVDQPKRDGEE